MQLKIQLINLKNSYCFLWNLYIAVIQIYKYVT